MPARIFMSVDLPAPFSPTTARTSPARSSSETRSRAWTPGKCLLTATTLSNGSDGFTVVTGAWGLLLDVGQLLQHALGPLLGVDRVGLADEDADRAAVGQDFLDHLADGPAGVDVVRADV